MIIRSDVSFSRNPVLEYCMTKRNKYRFKMTQNTLSPGIIRYCGRPITLALTQHGWFPIFNMS